MKSASHFFLFALLAAPLGCAAHATEAPPALAIPSARTAASRAAEPAPVATNNALTPFPAAQKALADEGVSGAMALYDSRDQKLYCSDAERCARGYIPASTFKIANTIIALETGIVSDADTVLPWDGKAYQNPDWNRDHTLRSAIQVSCVPCFQAIARKVGEAQMHDWVNRLDYGNRDIAGKIDFFWLSGALRITPLQQIDFLRRLDGEKLPIQAHTLDVVRDVITLDVSPDYVLRGKTGSAGPPEQPSQVAWFVGYVELGERRVFFATVLDGKNPGVDLLPVRRRVTERVLHELGDLPR
ncbi:MAG TPA: penicillin-binding transpeptidase domain-containing protein [Polyangiaceae bacterium]|jgi:beta-lactamase class D